MRVRTTLRLATRFQIAKKDITALFDSMPNRVFWPSDISRILTQHRQFWRLAQNTNTAAFLRFLLNKTSLTRIELLALHHTSASDTVRYVWEQASPYELALSLKRKAYLCPASAMFLNGLARRNPLGFSPKKAFIEPLLANNENQISYSVSTTAKWCCFGARIPVNSKWHS